ncbi:hypothetical protein FACS1894142_2550 [Spirochaetia bacterium]|nr:hypothetical protein FACS1894142_2550 [Spirochaetia bacterium]
MSSPAVSSHQREPLVRQTFGSSTPTDVTPTVMIPPRSVESAPPTPQRAGAALIEALQNLPDKNLKFVSSEMVGDTLEIKVTSKRPNPPICPYCNTPSDSVHSHYTRVLQDVPAAGIKVKWLLYNVKYRCLNTDCAHTTFAETFDFYDTKATVTKRLKAEIIRIGNTMDSVSAANYLREHTAVVSKSTICTLLKAAGTGKRRGNSSE